jgi:hypothetical protein
MIADKCWPIEDTAVHAKDRIFRMLNEQETETLLRNIDAILSAIELTAAIWEEAYYGYKAIEVVERCVYECNRLLSTCQHHKRLQRIAQKRDRARKLSEAIYQIKNLEGPRRGS